KGTHCAETREKFFLSRKNERFSKQKRTLHRNAAKKLFASSKKKPTKKGLPLRAALALSSCTLSDCSGGLHPLHTEGSLLPVYIPLGGVAVQGIQVEGVSQYIRENGTLILFQHLGNFLAALLVHLNVIGH